MESFAPSYLKITIYSASCKRGSYKLNQVNRTFLSGGSTNSLSLMKSSKSLMQGVNLELPIFFFFFSEILLMTLKSHPTHQFG